MLKVRGLKRVGLGPIDLSIGPGECVALSGPSGAGKTMLLRAIADLDPNDGDVRIEGVSRERVPAPHWRRRVVYVATDAAWWTDRVGAHFLNEDEAARLLPRLGFVADARSWFVSRLSTGEKQRLAFLRALLLEPSVLLLDEPTSGLDHESVSLVEDLLREHLDCGRGVLMVSHDPAQAKRLATRRIRIAEGRIVGEERQ